MNEMVGIVTIVVLVLAGLAMVAIALWQRKRLYRRLRLELANAGNVRSRYELRAQDPRDALAFEFSLDGDSLPGGSVTEAEEVIVAPVEAAPEPPAVQGPQRLEQGREAVQKGQVAAEQAMGAGGALADLLTAVGRLLPRSIGSPLLEAAGQLRSGESKAKRVQQAPGRVAAQAKRVGAAVPAGTVQGVGNPPATGSSLVAEGAVAEPVPAAAGPAVTSAPSAGFGAATRTRLRSWVQTPSVEPGAKLQLDLVVRPVKPDKSRHYAFEVLSRPVSGDEAEPLVDEWYIEISGAAGLRRYHPYLLVGALAILAVLVTSWLASMGVVG